ncbi:GtrA family protein [Companilactobacillus baiquanensis]|uniref:GtrA family protein n=1 Tax=Companilactobacillus baiquanensis TaxID=2486005 RepID=A0ABW1V059_9LACO|nr:GtrA family protein [Companilactobacillus baiquanensis]
MELIKKHRDFLVYCLFGFMASLINIIVFTIAHNNLKIPLWLANTIAWLISNVFSFFVTKFYVFKTKMGNYKMMFKEGSYFLASRLFSLLFDDLFMIVAVLVLPLNNIIIKVIDQLVVGLFNYFSSKWIFNYNNRNLLEKIKHLRSK